METLKNKGNYQISPASSVAFGQNVSGTDGKIDTPLTQPCSGDVPMTDFGETRSMLKKLAMAHGADTAIGRACHNILEMTENYSKAKDREQRHQLAKNIERAKFDLQLKLKRVSQ